MLLYDIFPFWLPDFVQAEYNLDKQRLRLYVEAIKNATMSEILAYLMAVGLQAVYREPTGLLQKLVFHKGSVCLFSVLVFARNHKNWLYAILNALDPLGPLQLRAQLELNIKVLLICVDLFHVG